MKEQCQAFFNQQIDNIKSYLDNINPEQVCQTIHLCSLSLVNSCSTCMARLDLKKGALLQATSRFSEYFNDLCQKNSYEECQLFAQQIHDVIQISLEEFNSNETCSEIGFCTTDNNGYSLDFDSYEESLTNSIQNKFLVLPSVSND